VLRDISSSGALLLIAESNSKYLSGMVEQLYLIERGKITE
jgi:hypothetical protein